MVVLGTPHYIKIRSHKDKKTKSTEVNFTLGVTTVEHKLKRDCSLNSKRSFHFRFLQKTGEVAYILNINHTNLRRREVDVEGLLPVWHQLKVRHTQKAVCG